MNQAPIVVVKERYKSKDQLVAAVQELANAELWLDRVNENKGLGRVSNRKLLRLHELLSFAKKEFGSREKLVEAILALESRGKDQGMKSKLESWPLPRLVDRWRVANRRSKEKAAGAVKKPAPRAAKPAASAAKKPAAKKPAKKQPARKTKAKSAKGRRP
jgi:hypothetical protein